MSGLGIYSAATSNSQFSQNGAFTNPFEVVLDGRQASSYETLLYLHNNNATYFYTSITVQAITTTGFDLTAGTNNYIYRLSAGSSEPSLAAWQAITPGSAITMSNIGSLGNADISTYLPLWVRIETPLNASVNTFNTIQLQISATQNNA